MKEESVMKIMGPVHNMEGAKLQIKAGADEIYVGLRSPSKTGMNQMTFTGRYNKSGKKEVAQVQETDELKEICKYAHENNVLVNFTANVRYLTQGLTGLYLEYVNTGIEAGIDTLIVGNIGAALLLKKEGIHVPLHSSTFLYGFNVEHIKFLEDIGFVRIVLATQFRMDEIREICKNTKAEIETFAQFTCSNINGRCNLLHTPYVSDLYDGYDMQCRGLYTIWNDNMKKDKIPILDAGLDCTICRIKELEDAGVKVLKITGRDREPSFIATITKIYRMCSDLYSQGLSAEEVRSTLWEKAPWWKFYCNKPSCIYGDTSITKTYI
jgi:putative protease